MELDFDLDELVEDAAVIGEIVGGISPELIAANGSKVNGLSVFAQTRTQNANRWTSEEDALLADELGKYPLEEIAARHGRSCDAIKIRFVRLGLAAPSKQPNEWSATAIARKMGMCGKSIAMLIDRDILPGRVASTAGNIRVVKHTTFMRWVVNPRNWIYFNHEHIRDKRIKALVERQRQRWDDEWWSPGQVAAYHGLTTSSPVNNRIRRGELPAVRWANWHILKSDAIACKFNPVGKNTLYNWSDGCQKFVVLARAIGLPHKEIARLIKFHTVLKEPQKTISYRLSLLKQQGELKSLVDRAGVQYENGRIFADWRDYPNRFPGLLRTVNRFLRGERLSKTDIDYVHGVLRTWSAWYAKTPEQIRWARRIRWYGITDERLHMLYEGVRSWADPFMLEV